MPALALRTVSSPKDGFSPLEASFRCLTLNDECSDGLKGQSGVFEKSGPFSQMLFGNAVAESPRVPASAGLSQD